MRQILIAAILGLGLMFGVSLTPANATVMTFNLTSDHCSATCLPGGISAGAVTVTDNGTGTLHFAVTLATGFGIINTGGGQGLGASFGFNLDMSPITLSNLVTPGGSYSLISTSAGSIHVDGFGDFSYGLNCDSCGNGATNPDFTTNAIAFDVTAGAGLTLADVIKSSGGSPNAFFALDAFSTITGATGPIDASTGTLQETIAEPQSLALLGVGLVAFGLVRRRRN